MDLSDIEDGPDEDEVVESHSIGVTDDVQNALTVAFLDGFHQQVLRLHDELLEAREEGEDDDLPMEISFGGVGLKTYEIHSLTASYFEAAVPILCYHHFDNETEEGYRILEWMEENRDYILDDDVEDPYGSQILDWLSSDRCSITDMARLMDETGLLSHDKVKRVRSHRNDFLHTPLEILHVSNWEDIIEMSERCVTVVEDVDERLFEDLEIHEIYNMLTDRDRKLSRF